MAEDDKTQKPGHDESSCPIKEDVLVPLAPIPGGALCLRHTSDHQIMIGPMICSQEGASMPDEAHVVEKGEDGVFRVGPTVGQLKTNSGPAQVATPEYRTSWERTFGKPNSALN